MRAQPIGRRYYSGPRCHRRRTVLSTRVSPPPLNDGKREDATRSRFIYYYITENSTRKTVA